MHPSKNPATMRLDRFAVFVFKLKFMQFRDFAALSLTLLVANVFCIRSFAEPLVIPLWTDGAPGFEDRKDDPEVAKDYYVQNIHYPTLTAYLPSAAYASGTAVIICPGGGHNKLVITSEGFAAAEYFASIGVTAFVLKYRLEREENSPYKIDVHAKQDGQRAMRLVRSQAKEMNIDPTKIGLVGFSAGGEVVSMIAYDDGQPDPKAADPIDRVSSKPDFQVLVYPGPLGIPHSVPADAPPAFFIVANDDGAAKNIIGLLEKYRTAKASVETHIYAAGGHGFNMGQRSKLSSINTWPDRLTQWMQDQQIIPAEISK